jgi:hypothetical protein
VTPNTVTFQHLNSTCLTFIQTKTNIYLRFTHRKKCSLWLWKLLHRVHGYCRFEETYCLHFKMGRSGFLWNAVNHLLDCEYTVLPNAAVKFRIRDVVCSNLGQGKSSNSSILLCPQEQQLGKCLELSHKHFLPPHCHSVWWNKAKQTAIAHNIVIYVIDRIPSPTLIWQKPMDSFRGAWGKCNPSSKTAEFESTLRAGTEYAQPLQWRSIKAVWHTAHIKQTEKHLPTVWWCTYIPW